MRSRSDALRSYICLLSHVNIGYLFAMVFQYPLPTTAPGGQTFQFVGLPKSELNKFSEMAHFAFAKFIARCVGAALVPLSSVHYLHKPIQGDRLVLDHVQ